MKIKISKLISIVYIIIALLSYHLFYLFSYDSSYLYGFRLRIEVAILGIFMYIFLLLIEKKILKSYKYYIHYYILATFISVCVTTVYATVHYSSQSILDTFGLSSRFLWVFWAVPLIYLFERQHGFERFMKTLNLISFIWMLSAIVQVIVYKFTGLVVFDWGSYLDASAFKRGTFLRIGLEALGNFFLLYNTLQLVEKKNKKNSLYLILYCLIGWPYLILVQQTRAFTVVVFTCLMIILFGGRKFSIKQIIIILVVLIGIMYVFTSGILDSFLVTFSITGKDANSTVSRLAGIEYYWSSFVNNPIWAMGFAHSAYYEQLIHGVSGRFFLDDIGIFGTLGQLGIFIIPVYIVPVIRMIYVYYKKRVVLAVFNRKLLLLIIIYIVSTSITLIITDSQRVILWPILIAIVEYINVHN